MLVHSSLIALALLSQPQPKSVLIRELGFDSGSAVVAANATHAILRQLSSRPDLRAIPAPDEIDPQVDADLTLDGGVIKIGSGYLAVLASSEAKTGRPLGGESCRAADESGLLACLIEAAERAVRGSDPAPVGRA